MADPSLRQYCTFFISGALFGIEVDRVQEIVRAQPLTPVPLAPPAVRGLINLRGQIVPAIDLRRCLQITAQVDEPSNVIIRTDDGPVSLLVDEVGEVVEVDDRRLEPAPENLRGATRALIRGVCQLPADLLLILSPEATISSLELVNTHGQAQAISLRSDRRNGRGERGGGEAV
jgi:purine-binding chemotaxis protein CheW